MIILIYIFAALSPLAILISLIIVIGMSFKLNDIEESLDIILHKLTYTKRS